MLKTIRSQMIFLQTLLLVITMGIVIVLFFGFANTYYLDRKLKVIEESFDKLQQEDVMKLDFNNPIIREIEGQNIKFVIADENFNNIYVTGRYKTDIAVKQKIERHIINRKDFYRDKVHLEKKQRRIVGYGLIKQNNHYYYVYMYEMRSMMNIGMSYERIFLIILSLVAVIIGIIVSYIIAGKISRPLKAIEKSASDAVANNFNITVNENQGFEEISSMAKNMNIMMSQIRKQMIELETEIEHKTIVEERRRQFVNNVSHELKTPLAVISSQVELIGVIEDEDKRTQYYDSVMEEIQEMSTMINNMMVVYSAQNDFETMAIEPVNISDIVLELCKKNKNLFENEGLTLKQNIEDNCRANANEYYIGQAISNYITNSVKHCKDNGQAYINVFKKDGKVRIEVGNDGENIPKGKEEIIWSMFYKGDIDETLNGQQGSGLGLYLVKSIVNLHNGTYGFKNLQQGVEFWIELSSLD